MHRYLLYIILLLLGLRSFAQTYTPESLRYDSGLPSDFIYQIVKKDGLLYIGNQRGIAMYDGYRFVKSPFLKLPTPFLISSKDSLYFFEEQKGFASLKNIVDSVRIIQKRDFYDKDPNNDHFSSIYLDKQGRLWSAGVDNIRFRQAGKTNSYEISQQPNDQLKVAFMEPNSTELWACTPEGIKIWNKKTQKLTPHGNSILAKTHFFSALAWSKDSLFLTEKDNLMLFILSKNRLISLQKSPQKQVLKLLKVKNELFVYDDYRLLKYLPKTNKLENIYEHSHALNHVFFDDETNIFWLSTAKGIIKLIPARQSFLTLPTASNQPVIDIQFIPATETWWFLNGSREVFTFRHGRWQVFKTPYLCRSLCIQGQTAFVATQNGIFQIKDKQVSPFLLTNFDVKKVLFDSRNRLWLLPEKGKIQVYRADTRQLYSNFLKNTDSYWQENKFNDIVESDGKIYLASWMPKEQGLSIFDEKRQLFWEVNTLSENNKKMVSDYFIRLAPTKKEGVLASAYGGWNKIDNKNRVVAGLNTDTARISNHHIVGIWEDKKENIWFASEGGLGHYNTAMKKESRFSQVEGLASDELVFGFFGYDSLLALGLPKGVQIIDNQAIFKSSLVNKLVLTSIVKDGKEIPLSNRLSLEHTYTELDIYFSALAFAGKDKIIYRYRLNDGIWNDLGNNPKITLVKLNHGTYDVTIRAGDTMGNWQEKELKLWLKINPPFYKTLGFMLLMYGLGIGVVTLLFRYFFRQEKAKNQLKRQLQNIEMQTLRTQMNPHFLFNSLNSINSFIIQSKINEASHFLTTFSKLTRNVLENSKHSLISLEKEIETLKQYVALEQLRLESSFDFKVNIIGDIWLEEIEIPPLILQPFVENAIWHGLGRKQQGGMIEIEIQQAEKLILIVRDNGVGREATKNLNPTKHKSLGSDITVNRLKLHHKQNQLFINDLKNPSGTEVVIEINL